MLAERLSDLMRVCARERLSLVFYRYRPESALECEVYSATDLALHLSAEGLADVAAKALAQLKEPGVVVEHEPAALAAMLEELFNLARRGGLALTTRASWPSGSEPYFAVECYEHTDGKTEVVCQCTEKSFGAALGEGLRRVRAHVGVPLETSPRERLSELGQ